MLPTTQSCGKTARKMLETLPAIFAGHVAFASTTHESHRGATEEQLQLELSCRPQLHDLDVIGAVSERIQSKALMHSAFFLPLSQEESQC
ncbi:uncharacterized protein MYCGRDRAFT_103476 [Zymoseptoria tritici IPO323]|uniref:Uncharacterized protein n=1 Tax=Zymoseptoria tritici (strain CBS 115943 / IPO323) TaxID=336722 RepID=F9X4Q7_ZYMTI|nr:uncharacterized protein MYCGRDRAFT_103476 [Zymoseptoria tritici IPO323]EGP90262.1 hypothetical protein MYCGRDRAFT_103476 [Zymoseptoria tritici IPO323]